MQHDAGVLLRFVDDFFVIGVHKERERNAVGAERRLDDIGDVMLVRLLVEIGEVLA